MQFSYLRDEIKQMGKLEYLKGDIFAGFSVAIVAIPLALAIAMASSVPPEMAIISAIVGGALAALLGGTRLGVSGPALSMTILIANCVAVHGLASLLVIGMVCGALQFGCGILRFGRFTRLIPLPVIHAFTSAIAIVLIICSIPSALQIKPPELNHVLNILLDISLYAKHMNPMALLLTIVTLVLARKLGKYHTKAPALLIAIIIPTLLVHLLGIKNILFLDKLNLVLSMPALPSFSSIQNWQTLLISSFSVFILATLETVLSATAIDKFENTPQHNANQELIGQGIANFFVALFGGIPITVLLTRSQINVNNGAKTRRAAIFHSFFVFCIVYFFPQFFTLIPIPVLAGVLISAAVSILDSSHALSFWRKDKFEFVVYLVTLVMLVCTNLVNGIQTGVLGALCIMLVRVLSTKSSIRLWANQTVMRISLSGNISMLSFEKIEKLRDQVVGQRALRFVIFEFTNLHSIDKAGCQNLIEALEAIDGKQIKIILHGFTKDQYLLFKSFNRQNIPFYNTVSESEIKNLLENEGIVHTANEVLKQGMAKFNEQYVNGRSKLIDILAKEQKPHTLLITCSDSRLNPNEFFSVGLGELFVIRNVGNVVPAYSQNTKYSEAAAIEYAIGALSIRNIIICAHTECGAIKASIQSPNTTTFSGLDNWLQIIKDGFNQNWPQNTNDGTKINLLYQVENLKTYPIIQELLVRQQLIISAWIYDVHIAHMLEWDELSNEFIQLA